MRAAVVLAALLVLAPAPAAGALPGDPPIVALSPKAGESVPANDAGITVSFTCPAYTMREANELPFFHRDPAPRGIVALVMRRTMEEPR